MISSMTTTLVFSWHFGESPCSAELCSAPEIKCFFNTFKPVANGLRIVEELENCIMTHPVWLLRSY